MKAVIFDIGRVLVHWDPGAVLAGLLEISQTDYQGLKSILRELSPKIDRGILDPWAIHRHMVQHAGSTLDTERFSAAFCSGLCRDDTMLAFVMRLRNRPEVKIGSISNTNPIHGRWLREQLPELAAFDDVVLSCDVGLLKPEPAIYQMALQRLSVRAQDALFVDDLPINVAGAEAVGMTGLVHQSYDDSTAAIKAWLGELG